MPTLEEVKEVQSRWFSPENKRFFGDKRYWVKTGKRTGIPYLVRLTDGWSDMFDGLKKPHYCLNNIDPTSLEIGGLIDSGIPTYHLLEFRTMAEVNDWLRER